MAEVTPPQIPVVNALSNVTRLGIDTAPFIYFVEANAAYFATCKVVFEKIQAGQVTGWTSLLTLTETLPLPLRNGDVVLESTYRSLLLSTTGIVALPVDSSIASDAADLRARYGLRTPDALQIAIALAAGCETFLTGDKGLRHVTELRVLVLDDLKP